MSRALVFHPFRLVIALALFGGTLLTTSQAAGATAAITLKPSIGPAGASTKVTGTGFGVTETVSIRFDGVEIGTTTTNGTGGFVVTVLVPTTALPGTHEMKAVGESSSLEATATFRVRSDWAMFRADARHSGEAAPENLINAGNVATLVNKWSFSNGGGDWAFPSPIVGGGMVFVESFAGDLHALRPSDGHELWSVLGSCCVVSTPAYAGGRVFWVNADTLDARNAKSGAFLWSVPIENQFSSPVVSGKTVYVVSGQAVMARKVATGAPRWMADLGATTLSSPAVSGGRLFVGADDNKLHALNAATGMEQWVADTGSDVTSSPAVDGTTVVVGTRSGVSAFDVATGTPLWMGGTCCGGSSLSSPAISGGVVYIGSWEQSIVAMDEATGETLWSGDTGGGVDSSPAVAGGVVFVGSHDHRLYAFDTADCGLDFCDPLWSVNTGGDVRSSPAVADGKVYIGGGQEYRAYGLPPAA